MVPGVSSAIAKWAPPEETGKFVFTSIGGTLGTVVTLPTIAFLMTHFGWVYAFYIPATIVLLSTVLWFYIVYNSPAEHPRIEQEEVKYIEASQGNAISRSQVIHKIYENICSNVVLFKTFYNRVFFIFRQVYHQSNAF